MTRRWRFGCWAGFVGVGIIGGCDLLPGRQPTPPTHTSARLLDSGPARRVTSKQAADVQFAIGRTHEEGEQLDQAEAAYRSALGKDPKRGDIEARLAIVLDRKGDSKQADEHFARALQLDPKNADLLCDRGYSYYLRGRNAEAEKSLRGALALVPNHPRSHTNLGLVIAARGDSEGAMAEFSRAGTDPADSRANLALALALNGRVEAARDQYAQALAAKPTSAPASEGLRVAASVLKAGTTPPVGLPRLPDESPSPAGVAIARTAPPTDAALVPTALAR